MSESERAHEIFDPLLAEGREMMAEVRIGLEVDGVFLDAKAAELLRQNRDAVSEMWVAFEPGREMSMDLEFTRPPWWQWRRRRAGPAHRVGFRGPDRAVAVTPWVVGRSN